MERFPNGARVCFVGDSITHCGLFIAHIATHYRQYFPDSRVEFYDCGISGGNLGNTIKIFDEDIAIYEPTHIVLMIGVNDSHRDWLKRSPSAERYAQLHTAYVNYGKNLETFYEMTKERGIDLTLCTPVPYAEYRTAGDALLPGGYALILGYAQFVKDFARTHGLSLCDYHTAITEAMQTEELYAPDGVHPTPRGHYMMARIFLAFQGLTIDEEAPFPADVRDWYEKVQKIRDIVAAEYFNVPNYTALDADTRMALIKKRLADVEAGADLGVHTEYFTRLMRDYLVERSHKEEYIAAVKEFMKK